MYRKHEHYSEVNENHRKGSSFFKVTGSKNFVDNFLRAPPAGPFGYGDGDRMPGHPG